MDAWMDIGKSAEQFRGPKDMSEKTELLKKALSRTKQEVAKVIIGQEPVVDKALIAIFSEPRPNRRCARCGQDTACPDAGPCHAL